MKLSPGKQLENHYWMEGPLSGDQGCRITVLHAGQVQQCSHCLKRADLCHGGGNGKACETLKTPRGKLSDYMKFLKERHGYTSMKMQFMEEQFSALGGNQDFQGGFGNIIEIDETSEDTVEDSKSKESIVSDLNAVKQQLAQAEAQIQIEQRLARTATRKLDHVEKVASQRIVECMPGENFDNDSNHLTMLLCSNSFEEG